MSSARSSHQISRGRDSNHATSESPRARLRSESRRISDRQRRLKPLGDEGNGCGGALHAGAAVKVFSRSASAWVDGEVAETMGFHFIRVEYKSGAHWCSKTMQMDSEHLLLPTESYSRNLGVRWSADESPIEENDPRSPVQRKRPRNIKSNAFPEKDKQPLFSEDDEHPIFREHDEVHYYRHVAKVWVYATITKVLQEGKDISYELKYEAWDEPPACMKQHKVSQKELLAMQESHAPQHSQGSLTRSIRTDDKPLWCRTSAKRTFANNHIRRVQTGDEVWFKRANRNAVVAEIEAVHDWEGEDARVDLTYLGLDEQDVPRRMHKEGVTRGELAILQHPRNWQPSPKRTWCSEEQQAAALASKQQRTQLHAASRDGDVELVRRLLLKRVDPTTQDEKDGSSALHVAAYHRHPDVLELLVKQVEQSFNFSEHKNWKGETPLDVARERLRFCPSNQDALNTFTSLFRRNPTAQERASRVMNCNNAKETRTYNQGFLEAVVLCPLIGDRTAPFSISDCKIDEIANGIEEEERRVKEYERPEYNDWSYWRASFDRGIRRHGIEDAFARRMDALKMRQLLDKASSESANDESALPRCAIALYTAATFLFKATNFAMRNKEHASKFEHLKPYASLLNHAVRYYAHKRPWKGMVHRVLPIYDDKTVDEYSKRAKAIIESERFFSWSGFISATAWGKDDGPSTGGSILSRFLGIKKPRPAFPTEDQCMIFQDLRKYGASKECLIFVIEPDPKGGSVYPVDLGDMAIFGEQDHELLYPAGQQFKAVSYEGRRTREQLAQDFGLKFDNVKDKGPDVHIVKLQAVEAFFEFADDFFRDGGNIQAAETFLQNRVQEIRRQGDEKRVFRYEVTLAQCWHEMGKYEEAESLFRRALKASEEELGLRHPDTLAISCNLAGLLQALGKYEEAEPLLRRALKAYEEELGLRHPDTLMISSNLAALLQAMGKYGEAEPLFHRTLKAREEELGLRHPNTLTSSNNLAELLKDMGKYEEAEPLLRRTLKASEEELGLRHPHTLASSSNLAVLLRAMGKYEEAEPLLRRALKASEEELGLRHPDTLSSSNNLAGLLQAMGKYEEAEPLLRRALKAYEEELGLRHPNTLTSSNVLAVLLQDMGKYEEAEPLLRRTLKASEEELGLRHPNTLTSSNVLAVLLHAMGKYEEAEPLYRRTLKLREEELGLRHPNTLTSSNNLAALLRAMGKYEEAEPLLRRALKASEEELGLRHPNTLGSSNNLAKLLQAMGKYEEAEPLLRRTLKAYEEELGLRHPDTLLSSNNLAALLQAMGKYEEAEPMLRRTLKVQEEMLGPMHPHTLNGSAHLALLLYVMGKHAEAEPIIRWTLEAAEEVLGPTHELTGACRYGLEVVLAAVNSCQDAGNGSRKAAPASEDADAERNEDGYKWSQNGDKVPIVLKLSKVARKSDVEIAFKPCSLTVSVHGSRVLDGQLGGKVDVDDCTWCLASGGSELHVELTKNDAKDKWARLMQ